MSRRLMRYVDSDEVDSCDDESEDGSDEDVVNNNVEMRNIGDFMLLFACTITY